ncbi:hypothetical protein Tco_0154735 [Tanacetum coccineum]
MLIDHEYVNCPIRFDDRIRPANLLPIHMLDFDVIHWKWSVWLLIELIDAMLLDLPLIYHWVLMFSGSVMDTSLESPNIEIHSVVRRAGYFKMLFRRRYGTLRVLGQKKLYASFRSASSGYSTVAFLGSYCICRRHHYGIFKGFTPESFTSYPVDENWVRSCVWTDERQESLRLKRRLAVRSDLSSIRLAAVVFALRSGDHYLEMVGTSEQDYDITSPVHTGKANVG